MKRFVPRISLTVVKPEAHAGRVFVVADTNDIIEVYGTIASLLGCTRFDLGCRHVRAGRFDRKLNIITHDPTPVLVQGRDA